MYHGVDIGIFYNILIKIKFSQRFKPNFDRAS